MGALFSIVGLAFVISGLLSLAKVTDAWLDFISQLKIHTLPFLVTFPVVWVYIVLGIILLVVAGLISRR